MSSSKGKKVHYERGTKSGKDHAHRSSRDSGVGSSSASDRASLGTSPENFSHEQIEDQRHVLGAVQEALNAAHEKIKQMEGTIYRLDSELKESNRENRMYKREKSDLLKRIEDLEQDLDERELKDRLRRDSTARTAPAPIPSSRQERRTTPPRTDARDTTTYRYEDERSQGGRNERAPPSAPRAPPNRGPNPFDPQPQHSRAPSMASSSSGSYAPPLYAPSAYSSSHSQAPSVTYGQSAVTYAPSSGSYQTAPPSDRYPNDGRYHPHPL